MGANHSRAGGQGQSHSNEPNDESNLWEGDRNEDLYETLQVPIDASAEEIKKAFKKQALIHHPDKNRDNVDQATRRFAKIQQAYEILNDEDERAFYDRHRDDLLNGGGEGFDFDPTHLRQSKPTSSSMLPGITVKQLLKFFDATIWKDDFSDSPTSFYSIYGKLFHLLATEEKSARHDLSIIYPSFGTSESRYDEDVNGTRALKYFYSAWSHFSTQKGFEWIELHHSTHQTERRIKRLIEKQNQRAREMAKREYNETVRSLVSFVKKRDPRYAASAAINPDRWRAQEIQRIRKELKQVAQRRAQEREDEAQQYREQAWQRQHAEKADIAQNDLNEESGEEHDIVEDEEVEQVKDWYCAACGKDFNSQGSWENHERSRKHRQNAHRLRRQMIEEDAALSLSAPASQGLSLSTTTDTKSSEEAPQPELSDNELAAQTPLEGSVNSIQLQKTNATDLSDTFESNKPGLDRPLESKSLDRKCSGDGSDGGSEDRFGRSKSTSTLNRSPRSKSEPTNSEEETLALLKARGKRNRKPKVIQQEVISEDESFIRREEVSGPPENLADLQSQKSKREKRRAKTASKKQNALQELSKGLCVTQTCNVCLAPFPSKTKLFEHIKAEGHAAAESAILRKSSTSSKSVKKKGR